MGSDSNKRIAKNTIFLYIRMLLAMLVSLYTSRVVLESLGVTDFGIYNVVGGVSTSLIFFSSALSTSTQRYLNFEHGRDNPNGVNNVFNISILLYSVIALLVVIVGFTLGQWFVENKLVIPENQKNSAVIVLYATTLSLASIFVFSVYESVLIARENMKIYAFLGIIDVFLKLGVAYFIRIVPNRLVFYSWLMLIVLVLPKLLMALYCRKKYKEAEFYIYWNTSLFKEMFGFTGWNIYGSAVWMLNGPGINVLLNMFFGPIVNAANAIAQQVNSAITNFGSNFFTAVRPQIVKRYSSGEHVELLSLIYASTRYSVYLLWILSLPIIIRSSQVLHIWLKTVPEYASMFVQWILIFSIVNTLNNPIWTALMATGKIKKTVIIGSNLFLLAFPASWMVLKVASIPWIVFPILCMGRLLFLIVALIYLSKEIKISFKSYFITAILPIIAVISVSYVMMYSFNKVISDNFIGLIMFVVLSIILTLIIILLLGTNKKEKEFIKKNLIKIT